VGGEGRGEDQDEREESGAERARRGDWECGHH
jgi:hypothetical protein